MGSPVEQAIVPVLVAAAMNAAHVQSIIKTVPAAVIIAGLMKI